jgi:O-antigen/teichoic acid export membrane protein
MVEGASLEVLAEADLRPYLGAVRGRSIAGDDSPVTIRQASVEPATYATRSVFRDSVIYGMGSVAGKVAGLLVVPLFTRLLTTDEFGRLDVLNALVSTGILVLVLGTDVAALRLFFDGRTATQQRQLLSTWYVLALAVAAPVGAVLIAASEPIAVRLLGAADEAGAVVAAGVALIAGTAQATTLGVLRALGRPKAYMLLEGGALVANAILAVVLLIIWKPEAEAVLVALASCWSVSALIGAWIIRPTISIRPTEGSARAILALGLPLAPAVVATASADFFNRAFLLGSAGATQAGYYSLALRYASIALLVSTAIQLAWQPHAFRLAGTDVASRRLADEARVIVVLLTTAAVSLQLVAPEAIMVIGAGQYDDSLPAVGLSLMSALVLGLFAIVAIQSVLAKKTHDVGIALTAGVILAVACTVLLAPRLGATGTALAVLIGNLCAFAIAAWLGRTRERLPFHWVRFIMLIGLGIIVMTATLIVGAHAVLPRVALAGVFAVGLLVEGTLPVLVRRWIARDARSWMTD